MITMVIRSEQIGERIKAARKNAGYSQEEAEAILNISRETLCKWEKGKTSPSVWYLQRISDAFKCDFGYIVGEYEEKTRPITDIKAETGLSTLAIEVLQSLKKNNCDDVLKLISDMIIFNIDDPIFIENKFILFQAISTQINLFKLDKRDINRYLWTIQDLFITFIKDQLRKSTLSVRNERNDQ